MPQRTIIAQRSIERPANSHQLLKNLDVGILGAPLIFPILIGIGFGHLERYKNPVCKSIGFLGNRCCVALTVVFGMPVLLYVLVKLILAKTVNIITFGKIRPIAKIISFTTNQFKVVQCASLASTLLLPQTKEVISSSLKFKKAMRKVEYI